MSYTKCWQWRTANRYWRYHVLHKVLAMEHSKQILAVSCPTQSVGDNRKQQSEPGNTTKCWQWRTANIIALQYHVLHKVLAMRAANRTWQYHKVLAMENSIQSLAVPCPTQSVGNGPAADPILSCTVAQCWQWKKGQGGCQKFKSLSSANRWDGEMDS